MAATERRAVLATYRIQLHAGFTFDDAAAIAGYLRDLGISHLYCSPYLQATAGSTHGYDVVDHHRLNDELGGAPAHARMTAALVQQGLAQVLDIVPNHMAVAGRANTWWWDVLENGPSSQYASYFDIDWDPPERKLIAQVLVPVLGDHYGRVLENGELQLVREDGSFTVRYHEHEVPVSPRSLDDVVARAAERLEAGPVADQVASLGDALGRLPHALVTDRKSVVERHRDKEVLRQRLADLVSEHPEVAVALDEEVKALNEDFDALDALLERQNYRLAFWRTAGRELDYRRFFDITNLVALRAEEPDVFADTHELVLQLVEAGVVQGLRVDHVDGLRDPQGYLERLRAAAGPDTFLVVEKILEGEERLPASWPVEGTSGYDFLAQVNDLLVDPAGEDAMSGTYQRFTGETAGFEELARAAKHEIMRSVLAADIERLTEQLAVVAERHRRYRDYTRSELRDALRETIAGFSRYRTYVRRGHEPQEEDVWQVERAVRLAAQHRPSLDPDLLGFLADVLLLRCCGAPAGTDSGPEVDLAERFQQVSSPVMAKSVEDTAFYRYLRLVSLNEVGGDPGRFGRAVAAFHERRIESTACSLLGSSTHDTKRSEDVRARLAALSEMPAEWEAALWRWAHHNDRHRREGLPDRNTEYLLYQTLVGAWPLPVERAVAYMEKATKEAKTHTSWIDPVADYDEAVRSFTEAVLADPEFVAEVEAFLAATGLVAAGWHNSLTQVALKLTCPGVPDVYQGTELWDLSLVDPDNRRPVDYERRRRLLAEVTGLDAGGALARMDEGVPKLWLIQRLLRLRNEMPELFGPDAAYEPLEVVGADRERVVAFMRAGLLAVVTTRLPGRGPVHPRTTVRLPPGPWQPVLSGTPLAGGPVSVAALVSEFPAAVLERDGAR
ncbi:MAG: malto-oligosyltrehalose synthase [Actinobacteria bacterium]|nr:malto-oligosyltrehalose synthase [Actinomycetota bacterium]MBW3649400.1 malto-oligosyltrehalose synthase [Actinomycetota bacterium]